jgi:hypothetical protein
MESLMQAKTEKAQIWLTRSSAAYWRVTFDNPPLNVMGPQLVREFREIIAAVEADEKVKVLVFESGVEGFFSITVIFAPISRSSPACLRDRRDWRRGPTSSSASRACRWSRSL